MKELSLPQWIRKKKTRNPRVGHNKSKPASHTVGTSFRELVPAEVAAVQRWYSTGYFTQKELANIFGVSIGIISKCCRCVKVAKISYIATPKKDNSKTDRKTA